MQREGVAVSLQKAATYYANMGWYVFPCKDGQKIPLTKNGVKDASCDPDQIASWWARWPNANIGLACGPESNVAVVDIDVKGSANGFDEIHAAGWEIPNTLRQQTPTGGAHYFYEWDASVKNKNNFKPGVDIRSANYYVMLAPSIHPNGGVYELHGNPQEKLAAYPEHFKPQKPVYKNSFSAATFVPEDAEIKAIEYLGRCDAAFQGVGGHDALLSVATVVVQGFAIAPERAKSILWEYYNPRCCPPWDRGNQSDVKDFERKVDEVVRRPVPKPYGWMLSENDEDLRFAAKTISNLLKNDAKKNSEPPKAIEITEDEPKVDDIDFLLQPSGMVGELYHWIADSAPCPQPLVNLGAALVAAGTLVGPKFAMGKTRSNLMAAGLADSSAGKNHAQDAIKELFIEAGIDDLYGGNDVTSDTAICKVLERSPHNQTIFMMDEFGHILANLGGGSKQSSPLATILSTLMKLYSSAHTKYVGKAKADEEPISLYYPHVCMWATSTPNKAFNALNEDQVEDGFIPRLLWFVSESLVKFSGDRDKPAPLRLIDWARAMANKPMVLTETTDLREASRPKPTDVRVSDGAKAIFNDYVDVVFKKRKRMEKKSDVMHAMWGKCGENANKIAMILAVGENMDNPVVSPANMDYATRLVDYLTEHFVKRLRQEVHSDIQQQNKNKLCTLIRKFAKAEGRPIRKAELTRKTQWLDKRLRDQLVLDLIEAERITIEVIDTHTVFNVGSAHSDV